jgi:ribosomal protein L20
MYISRVDMVSQQHGLTFSRLVHEAKKLELQMRTSTVVEMR